MVGRQGFDWAHLTIRFLFGCFPGILLGFGFWVQMCRHRQTLGAMEHVPRLVTEWLGLEQIVDTGAVGATVVAIFAITSGIVVAAWPSIARCYSQR